MPARVARSAPPRNGNGNGLEYSRSRSHLSNNDRVDLYHQFSSKKPKQTVHRQVAGAEAAKLVHGPVDIDSFLEIDCFPGMKVCGVKNERVVNITDLLRQVDPTIIGANKRSERLMYSPLAKALNEIAKKAVTGRPLPVKFDVCGDLRPAEEIGGFRTTPDLSIQPRRKSKNHGSSSDYWARGLGIIEVKATEQEDPWYQRVSTSAGEHEFTEVQLKTWNQIQEYAVMAYRAVSRCFLLGMGFFGDVVRFFRWDRSSIIVSDPVHYKVDPAPLITFVVGLAKFANSGIDRTAHTSLGTKAELALVHSCYDEAVHLGILSEYTPHRDGDTLDGESTRIVVESPQKPGLYETFLAIGRPMFYSRSVRGRGTRVWLAKRARRCEDGFVVIKDTWRNESRWTEGEIYGSIYKGAESVFGVARFYHDFDVPDPVSKEMPCCTAAARLNEEGTDLTERIHHRCVLLSVGIPLDRFKSTKQLLHAIRDAVEGHRNMCSNGVLHRDISPHNIMISVYPEREMGARGFLIDPELAVVDTMPDLATELHYLTGTPPFMAIDRWVDDEADHEEWHDLESFFWVLVFVVIRHTPCYITQKRVDKPAVEFLPSLYDTYPSDRNKKTFLTDDAPNLTVVNNPPLTACIKKLASIVYSHYYPAQVKQDLLPGKLNQLTHAKVIATLDEFLKSAEWPSEVDDAAVPFEQLERHSVQQKQEVAAALNAARLKAESGRSSRISRTSKSAQVAKQGQQDRRTNQLKPNARNASAGPAARGIKHISAAPPPKAPQHVAWHLATAHRTRKRKGSSVEKEPADEESALKRSRHTAAVATRTPVAKNTRSAARRNHAVSSYQGTTRIVTRSQTRRAQQRSG
ncbi:hypothetical protein GLOTRDRAFT_131161 [Gloeophyllum trabeum ATCC 11539]|uniref:Fungal-type protein kinase domain-containing protein n=1 Tax=Gloeophyllum trabeum (strain ATCC 11539 / FP-39264 / Madison 617) TaxID=670483 RepID=S7Q1I4_GLOTA|nr:uncharacterized protein GLOTRDRAFT_131161 [Gloeophyllum trabeum ATCC 11539]EPQ53831.1 hypothetical protein GLOTRDRAFT_131161 [Gloeophyllum trabeum ATCC 11539]